MEGDPGGTRSVERDDDEEERRDRKEVPASEEMEEERPAGLEGEERRLLARLLSRVEVEGGTTA